MRTNCLVGNTTRFDDVIRLGGTETLNGVGTEPRHCLRQQVTKSADVSVVPVGWLLERPSSKSQQLQCKERLQQEVCSFSACSVSSRVPLCLTTGLKNYCTSVPSGTNLFFVPSSQSAILYVMSLSASGRTTGIAMDSGVDVSHTVLSSGPMRDQLNSSQRVTSVTSASAQICTPIRPFLFRTSSVTSTPAKSCAPLLRCRVITMLVSRLKALSRVG